MVKKTDNNLADHLKNSLQDIEKHYEGYITLQTTVRNRETSDEDVNDKAAFAEREQEDVVPDEEFVEELKQVEKP